MKKVNGLIIPQRFEVKTLNDILLLLKDGTHNPPKRTEKGIPLLTGKMFGNIFLDYKDVTYIKEEDYNLIHSKYEPQYRDCILTKIGTLGNVNLLRKRDIPIAIHCNSALLRFYPEYNGAYSLCLLKSNYFQKKLRTSKGQSVQEFISLDSLSKIQIVVPQTKHIKLFNNFCNQLFEKMEVLSYELERLKKIKTTILPLLMNGQVKVL